MGGGVWAPSSSWKLLSSIQKAGLGFPKTLFVSLHTFSVLIPSRFNPKESYPKFQYYTKITLRNKF